QLAEVETGREHTLRQIFDQLNTDSASPLVGKLSASQSLTGRISRVTFNRAVGPVLTSAVLLEMPSEDRYRLIRNFLNALDAELVDKTLLTRSAFFEALFAVFDEVIQKTITTYRTAKQVSIQAVIQPLARLDYHGSGGRAILNKNAITSLMQSTLRQGVP